MKLIHDYYIVQIDQRYESGNKLKKINTAIFRDTQDAPEQRDDAHYRHKRLYGTIVACPLSFTDTVVSLIDPGKPGYGVYISHDFIVNRINQGFRGRDLPQYRCSTFESFDRITMADYAKEVDVQTGDKVYFSYLVTEPENHLHTYKDGRENYKVLPTDIFCVVRRERSKVDGRYRTKIIMQGEWVLVEPNFESWEEIRTPSGIYKKPQPEVKVWEGTVRHIRPDKELKSGDYILYEPLPFPDIFTEVEGKQYYCLKLSEILVKA